MYAAANRHTRRIMRMKLPSGRQSSRVFTIAQDRMPRRCRPSDARTGRQRMSRLTQRPRTWFPARMFLLEASAVSRLEPEITDDRRAVSRGFAAVCQRAGALRVRLLGPHARRFEPGAEFELLVEVDKRSVEVKTAVAIASSAVADEGLVLVAMTVVTPFEQQNARGFWPERCATPNAKGSTCGCARKRIEPSSIEPGVGQARGGNSQILAIMALSTVVGVLLRRKLTRFSGSSSTSRAARDVTRGDLPVGPPVSHRPGSVAAPGLFFALTLLVWGASEAVARGLNSMPGASDLRSIGGVRQHHLHRVSDGGGVARRAGPCTSGAR